MFEFLELEVRGADWSPTARPPRASSGIGYDSSRTSKQSVRTPKSPKSGKSLLERQKEALDADPRLKFLDAAKRGDLDLIQQLTNEAAFTGGVDIVVTGDCARRDLVGKTALQLAASKGHEMCVQFLLDQQAKVLTQRD